MIIGNTKWHFRHDTNVILIVAYYFIIKALAVQNSEFFLTFSFVVEIVPQVVIGLSS